MPRPAVPAWCVALVVAAAVALLWLAWSPLDANDLVGGDEGYYGTLARNLNAGPSQWLSPSLQPLGPPGDKPPLYSALLALAVARGGAIETALRWPSIAMAVLIAVFTGLLAARAVVATEDARTPSAGWIAWAAAPVAAALFMTLPWVGDASRSAMSDIPLTAFGGAALLVIVSGPPTVRRALVAGALLGLAFQCKLWLAGVFALPAFAALLPGSTGPAHRQASRRPASFAPVLALAAAGLTVGSLHLLAVALCRPGDLGHWWDVYWRQLVVERVTDTASPYARPAGYYVALLEHALVLAMPLAGIGLDRLARRWREPAAAVVLLGCAAPLALSAFTVKSAVYLYALLPAWAAAAAVGAAVLAAGTARPGPVTALVALAGAPLIVERLGGDPVPVVLWAGLWLALVVAIALVRRRPGDGWAAAFVLCAIAIGGGLLRQSQRLPLRYHDPGYREVAAALAPRLSDLAPAAVGYVAPEAPAFAAYLFRSGRYWGTPRAPWRAGEGDSLLADSALRAFIVDPRREAYGGWPDSATVDRLASSMREITGDIERGAHRPIGVRVFVREPVRR